VLRSVQTPQGFRRDVLAAAHAAATDPLTDDAGLVEKAGVAVTCVPGSDLALKITRPLDLVLAEALLRLA
jgi:2-C-methyl-D-erythritol 4-phosphate cytidylyltransferase